MPLDLVHARQLLEAHQPFDGQEGGNKQATLAFLQQVNPTIGRTDDGRKQLTAAGWVIDPAAQKILLIRNEKMGKWLNPGGKYEPEDTTVLDTMRREVFQETGLKFEADAPLLDISPIGPDYNPRLKFTMFDFRFLIVADSRLPLLPQEIDKMPAWYSLAEAQAKTPSDIQNYRMYRRTEALFNQ